MLNVFFISLPVVLLAFIVWDARRDARKWANLPPYRPAGWKR